MRYIFPFKDIQAGSRIIIYGASQTGYDFYRQIKSTGYCEIVAWVDRQYKWWRELNLPVNPTDSIIDKQYDWVILTAEKGSTAESMMKTLEELGIPQEKCIWKDDYSIGYDIVKTYDPDRVRMESEEAVQESPLKYLNDKALDIFVRVLYARDILESRDIKLHRDMYKKLLLNQHGGNEPVDQMAYAYFTEYEMKKGWDAFNSSFIDLVLSMRDKGFDRNYFIPIDSEGTLINGRHRLSAAIATNNLIWTRSYSFHGFHFCFNSKWLEELGFSDDEIAEVLAEYHRLVK